MRRAVRDVSWAEIGGGDDVHRFPPRHRHPPLPRHHTHSRRAAAKGLPGGASAVGGDEEVT